MRKRRVLDVKGRYYFGSARVAVDPVIVFGHAASSRRPGFRFTIRRQDGWREVSVYVPLAKAAKAIDAWRIAVDAGREALVLDDIVYQLEMGRR